MIHPSLFGYVYGSGFPKATRIKDNEIFEGYRYGLQALKPALEPIIVFQKPYEGRPVENITETGAGALNIDFSRIGIDEIPSNQWDDNAHPFGNGAGNTYTQVKNKGRWPSNFILLDEEAGKALDKQVGYLVGPGNKKPLQPKRNEKYMFGMGNEKGPSSIIDRGGNASRFFFSVQEKIDESDPVYYCAKASRIERDAGLDDKPLKPSQKWNKGGIQGRRDENAEEIISQGLDARGRTLIREDGSETLVKRFVPTYFANNHPTVKPIELTQYLATLLLPPPEYSPRRIFIPFAGVASECIGANSAGWEEVTGVELTKEYIPIAEARIKYWNIHKTYKPSISDNERKGQLNLFEEL